MVQVDVILAHRFIGTHLTDKKKQPNVIKA